MKQTLKFGKLRCVRLCGYRVHTYEKSSTNLRLWRVRAAVTVV